jgi:hypothetical protein
MSVSAYLISEYEEKRQFLGSKKQTQFLSPLAANEKGR